jgi:hypothetical protein
VHQAPRGSDGGGALSMRLSLDSEIEAVQSFSFKVSGKTAVRLEQQSSFTCLGLFDIQGSHKRLPGIPGRFFCFSSLFLY